MPQTPLTPPSQAIITQANSQPPAFMALMEYDQALSLREIAAASERLALAVETISAKILNASGG